MASQPASAYCFRLGLLLALWGHCLAAVAQGQAGPENAQLKTINDTFHARLKSTYNYQQAVLPVGCTAVERYLQVGTKRYLLEYAVKDLVTGEQLREDYSLRLFNHDTVRVIKAKYLLSGKIPRADGQLALGSSIDYVHDDLLVVANNLSITQNFDPMLVLALRPGPAQTGNWLYVRQFDSQVQCRPRTDTVAGYFFERSRTGDTCLVRRYERGAGDRPWRGHAYPAHSWLVELAQRRITAEAEDCTWVRTYATATDFTEVSTSSWLAPGAGCSRNPKRSAVRYRRTFRQLSPGQSVDTYDVVNGEPTAKPSFTFCVVSIYH